MYVVEEVITIQIDLNVNAYSRYSSDTLFFSYRGSRVEINSAVPFFSLYPQEFIFSCQSDTKTKLFLSELIFPAVKSELHKSIWHWEIVLNCQFVFHYFCSPLGFSSSDIQPQLAPLAEFTLHSHKNYHYFCHDNSYIRNTFTYLWICLGKVH